MLIQTHWMDLEILLSLPLWRVISHLLRKSFVYWSGLVLMSELVRMEPKTPSSIFWMTTWSPQIFYSCWHLALRLYLLLFWTPLISLLSRWHVIPSFLLILSQMARGSTRNVFIWSQLWMYFNLPSWIPIVSTSLTCLFFLILIDTLGWVYGFLTWLLLAVLILDKLSQGIIERGIYRMHQGLVLGYFLSILWINLRYFGGVEYLLGSSLPTPSFFFLVGKNIPPESVMNLSSRSCLMTCALSVFSLFLGYLASVKKSKAQTSTEDRYISRRAQWSLHSGRTHLLNRIIKTAADFASGEAHSLEEGPGTMNLRAPPNLSTRQLSFVQLVSLIDRQPTVRWGFSFFVRFWQSLFSIVKLVPRIILTNISLLQIIVLVKGIADWLVCSFCFRLFPPCHLLWILDGFLLLMGCLPRMMRSTGPYLLTLISVDHFMVFHSLEGFEGSPFYWNHVLDCYSYWMHEMFVFSSTIILSWPRNYHILCQSSPSLCPLSWKL